MHGLKRGLLWRLMIVPITLSALPAQLLAETNISPAKAATMAEACTSQTAEKGWPPFSIAIYTLGGQLKYFVSMDGAMPGSIDLAQLKGRSSSNFPFSTRQIAEIANTASGAKGLRYLTEITSVAGGLPIMDNGKHIGGIGVSGGLPEVDEACALLVRDAF